MISGSLAVSSKNIKLAAGAVVATVDETQQHNEKTFLYRKTITTRQILDLTSALGTSFGGDTINLAAVLDMAFDRNKVLRRVKLRTLANDVVTSLMGVTLD